MSQDFFLSGRNIFQLLDLLKKEAQYIQKQAEDMEWKIESIRAQLQRTMPDVPMDRK